MQTPSDLYDLPHDAFLAMAQRLIAFEPVTAVRKILIVADKHPRVWASDLGQLLLADILRQLYLTLAEGEISSALDAFEVCPANVAQQVLDMIAAAVLPDGPMGDLTELPDTSILCIALLMGASGQADALAAFLDHAGGARTDPAYAEAADTVRGRFLRAAPKEAFSLKLIVWDLDDTLWQGTLADGEEPVLDPRRAAFVRAFNQHGVVSAICSKNDFEKAKAKLQDFALWDEFVFPRIAFLPKGEVVKALIADMGLRPVNVLFIDDNPRNLSEVAAAALGIEVIDATSPDCDELLQRLLDDNRHVNKSRLEEYRVLEGKTAERSQSALTDEAFLLQSGIHATFARRMDNLDFADRIEELINRSNQLNYTGSRLAPGEIKNYIMNVPRYEVFSALVWDRYGYYGLVGAAIFDRQSKALIHFVFSCRIMHMGVEDFLLQAVRAGYGEIDLGPLHKPLPPQSSRAITAVGFEDPAVRARVLAKEAPRDWSKINVRVMCDCQSGALHHYSRFREDMDFDNWPRLFTLPVMLDEKYKEQNFPQYLVYAPSTDYMDVRWQDLTPSFDMGIYVDAMIRFCGMAIASDRKLLLIFSPEDMPEEKYQDSIATGQIMQARHRRLNTLWRDFAARHRGRVACLELDDFVVEADLITSDAVHYGPSTLQRMAGMIDDWYEAERDVGPQPAEGLERLAATA